MRTESGGNFVQARVAIAEEIVRYDGNINKLIDAKVTSEYATARTKKVLQVFLKKDIKPILNNNHLNRSEKIKQISIKIDKFQTNNSYTIHKVDLDSSMIQLVPTEINGRFRHAGGVSDYIAKYGKTKKKCTI